MIYKLTFIDGRIDWCTAKSQLHLLQNYESEYDLSLKEIDDVQEISDEEAKTIEVINWDYNENDPDETEKFILYDLAIGDDFAIIASTEYE